MSIPVEQFLSQYDEQVVKQAMKLRQVLLENLPGIIGQVDLPAKMIAYCYGQKYSELICVLIPSKKGLKLGFNRGNELPDPERILEGTGKISRHVLIKSEGQIESTALKEMLSSALALFQQWTTLKKLVAEVQVWRAPSGNPAWLPDGSSYATHVLYIDVHNDQRQSHDKAYDSST
jgi:hypothetical protein